MTKNKPISPDHAYVILKQHIKEYLDTVSGVLPQERRINQVATALHACITERPQIYSYKLRLSVAWLAVAKWEIED